ncbi:OLC1v1033669C1 [Oldenlandia corymbosa var. corymbosa]|uniref:OLC1v1033669C1 n=1 Tax=Oldenlandia corymbosa var. corymbosa TaxID=529605 RepID=A0AAV1CPI6_OLDCO|nr:OLC1v1033669C1 [Oldenlandia corymbosa var. corymbosa]
MTMGSNSSGLSETNNTPPPPAGGDGGGGGGDDIGAGLKIKVEHGSITHDVSVPPDSTFGDLKKIIPQITGKLLFRGKEKEDSDLLQMAGVKDNSKIIFMETPGEKVMNEPIQISGGAGAVANEPIQISKGGEAVALVRAEVDKLSEQVSSLEAVINAGSKVDDKQIVYVTEMLMRQLLKLDTIEAEGEGRIQRKQEVRRVQGFVDAIDTLKAKNSNPFFDGSHTVPAPTHPEPPASGTSNISAPNSAQLSTKVTEDWEQFD